MKGVQIFLLLISLTSVVLGSSDQTVEESNESDSDCSDNLHSVLEENEILKQENVYLRNKLEDLEEATSRGSDESHHSRSLRSRRGITCESGTLATWACAPQCVFKLKGLCGLSLKSICHC